MKEITKNNFLKKLPSVDEILKEKEIKKLLSSYSRKIILDLIRESLDEIRQKIISSSVHDIEYLNISTKKIISTVKKRLEMLLKPSLKKLINGTGTILHTNLGRALLGQEAIDKIVKIAGNYTNLEFNINSGKRFARGGEHLY